MEVKVCVEKLQSGYLVYEEGNKDNPHVATTVSQVQKAARAVITSALGKTLPEKKEREEEEDGQSDN